MTENGNQVSSHPTYILVIEYRDGDVHKTKPIKVTNRINAVRISLGAYIRFGTVVRLTLYESEDCIMDIRLTGKIDGRTLSQEKGTEI